MTKAQPKPSGFLTFTLHAHLPYVINHGTWPHGLEWLHEAAAETYLPLLRVLKSLEHDKVRFQCNLNLSPVLLEQLSHPLFLAEFPNYLNRKITAAREDEAYFLQANEHSFAKTARFWQNFFTQTLKDFHSLDRDLVGAFRHFNDTGLIDIITCGATHGYMPLLGTDESVRAQVRTAVSTHTRHFGKAPRGIWAPECGYRPAGTWSFPVHSADDTPNPPPFDRIGVEQALSESGLEFFFVDTHLVEDAQRSLYRPHYVAHSASEISNSSATIFPRDPRTGIQIWSGDSGYYGDPAYLDFHKKRWPGGHRYWRGTGPHVDMDHKQPYSSVEAAERIQSHAAHFVQLVQETLSPSFNNGDSAPPILCAPFDAELFGHWWFEGAQWLEAVARNLHESDTGIQLTTCTEYLDRYPRAGSIKMHEGSWGAGGNNQVWLNPETSWTYTHLYPAELYVRDVCTAGHWRNTPTGKRIAQQLCRELLLLESSDWQSLITTGAARDYAETRFLTHHDQFNELKTIWQNFESTSDISQADQARLAEIELRDSIFSDIDPNLWAAGAKQSSVSMQNHGATVG